MCVCGDTQDWENRSSHQVALFREQNWRHVLLTFYHDSKEICARAHTYTHTQWFCESHDLAILNMLTATPENNSVQFKCGSLGWKNVPFNQHRLSHKEPSEKCSALHLPLSSNACSFYIFLLYWLYSYMTMSILFGDIKEWWIVL